MRPCTKLSIMITPWLSQRIKAITFPIEWTLLNLLGGVSQGVSFICSAFLTLGQSGNPCLILGYTPLDKIAGIIFIGDTEKYRAKSFSDYPSTFVTSILSKLWHTQDVGQDWLYCPKTHVHFASYASQVSPPFTHNQRVNDLDIFISGGIFGAARLSIILNALSPPLKLCCPFLHCAIKRRLLSKSFHEVLEALLSYSTW